jgi:2-pyrone-4,6-dicarboxylate lactonase
VSGAVTYHQSPSRPRLKLPEGACDAHCHVFGPQAVFPYPADARFKPADAPKEKLFALHELLGIETCVIVQSGAHGFDNRAVADALAAKGGRYRGVALLPHDADPVTIKTLDAQGFRGVRFNFMAHLAKAASIEEVVAMGARLAGLGWHLQVHFEASLIGDLLPVLARSEVPVVIDHMARIDAGLGLDQPAYHHLLSAMEDERFWVKVSGCDRATRTGPPYQDAAAMARDLVARFPDRVVWGTDWPHPNHQGPIPDDGALVDLIADIAPSEELRQKLMVDNPQRLYRFAPKVPA